MNGTNTQLLLQKIWNSRNPIALVLWPISVLYCGAVEIRRLAYKCGIFRSVNFDYPVLVVGNVTVGGSGKTPLTIWLVKYLKNNGFNPGIVSRGYGRDTTQTLRAYPDSDPKQVGDEPVLIARHTQQPVAVAQKRADAVNKLLAETDCNIFISDDGLQHLALKHDISIAVVDFDGMQNSMYLPAGPLRERKSILNHVDFILTNESTQNLSYHTTLKVSQVCNIKNRSDCRKLESFSGCQVHAIAGIRNPQRFFSLLNQHGIKCQTSEFPDHHEFRESDFENIDNPQTKILMTEKDAVKCETFARSNWWAVAIDVEPDNNFKNKLLNKIKHLSKCSHLQC